ncbi:unnamed protein product [Paramecium octaurelia]|uniref:Uncharacterized protein n=1 Tax=Paramecium octaurelia TaxID=43137 RepID=A0A8S1YJR5_PAROT|nr:unnamed protein product [Paramecium octaurelia]
MEVIYIILGCLISHQNSKCVELKINPKLLVIHSLKGVVQQKEMKKIFRTSKKSIHKLQKSHAKFHIKKNRFQLDSFVQQIKFNNITYTEFDLVLYEEQTNYSELIRINTKILANEFCDELFRNEDESLINLKIIFFKIIFFGFSKNVNSILEHDVSDQIKDQCKKKQFIIFYQCSKWKVLLIQNNQANTLFDSQMKCQDSQLSNLSFIDDVAFCNYNYFSSVIYLIENNIYLQLNFNQDKVKIMKCLQIQYANRIQKILIQPKCLFMILVNELDESDQSQKALQILLNQNYSMNNIHFSQNLLFLQNQFQLDVLINVRINQTYQICNTTLYFFDFDNLFCQYDSAKKVLQFYKYYALSTVVKPKQKYVYVIQKINLFRKDDIISCFKFLDENNTQKEIPQSTDLMIFQNNCQNKQYQIWKPHYPNYFKNSTYNFYSVDGSLNLSIQKYQDFQHYCIS